MPDPGPGTRRIFVVTPGFERALMAELGAHARAWSTPGGFVAESTSGLVNAAEIAPAEFGGPGFLRAAAPVDPVFARQQLPAATEVRASSIAVLAESVYVAVEAAVDRAAGPFAIHAFTPTGAEPGLPSRANLIATALLVRLRQRRRRAARFYQDPARPEAAAPTTVFAETKLLIQVLLMARDRAWVSAAPPHALATGGWDLAPWPGGVAPVAEDRLPPSRAYRKLEEAFLWMAAEPKKNQLCVDLGGAPGGWTYTALRRDARVIAVDRAPLAPPVKGHTRLTMIAGNAFTYEPPSKQIPVDWVLSDVICEPARTLAQMQRWLRKGWARRLVMTIKFKGQDGYGMLGDVRAALAEARCPRWRIKHLQHNKNEVTVMATAAEPGPSAGLAPPR